MVIFILYLNDVFLVGTAKGVLGFGTVECDVLPGEGATEVACDTTDSDIIINYVKEEAGRVGMISHDFLCILIVTWICAWAMDAWKMVGLSVLVGVMVVTLALGGA